VIAGFGTLVLANVRARADTAADLGEQAFNTAADLASFFDESSSDQPGGDRPNNDPLTEEELEQRLRNLTLRRVVVRGHPSSSSCCR